MEAQSTFQKIGRVKKFNVDRHILHVARIFIHTYNLPFSMYMCFLCYVFGPQFIQLI